MPTPRPDTFVTLVAVENPGTKIRLTISRGGIARSCSTVARPRSIAFVAIRAGSMPAPSSLISMLTWPPSWKARSVKVPSAGFPCRDADFGRFDAVVDRIADDVGQRILDRLEDRLVQLGVAALQLEPNLATAGHRQIAHHARQLAPDRVDRLHPGLHDAGLELADQQVQSLRRTLHAGVRARCRGRDDLIAGEHQFADEPHQGVEQVDVDPQSRVADRPAGARVGLRGRLKRQCLAHLCRRGLPVVDEDLAERPVVAELLLEHRDRDVLGIDVGLLLKQFTEQRNVRRRPDGGAAAPPLPCALPGRL